MEVFYKAAEGDSKLKRICESRAYQKSELAEESGVHLRNIQMWANSAVNNIDKAQAHML